MRCVKYIFFLFAALIFGYIAAGQILLPANELDRRNVCYEYTEKWYLVEADGTRKEFAIPGKSDFRGGILETTIPMDLSDDVSCMYFRAQDFQAYLDGRQIFAYSTEHTRWFGKHSPEGCAMIPLTVADRGRTLRIELYSDTGLLYQPYVGTELGIWMHLLREYMGELLVAVLTFIVGMLTILISTVYGWFNKRKMDIVYLGCGVVVAAIWLVANSLFRQLIFPNISVASDLPFLTIMLIPFPFLFYMDSIQESRFVRLYRTVGMIMVLIDICCCALYVTGIRSLMSTFIFVALGCFISIVAIIVSFIVDIRNGKIKEYSYVAFGLLGAFATSVIQLIIYFNRTGVFRGYFLAIGLLLLLLGASIHTVRNVFSIEKDKRAAVIANEAKGKFLANMSHEIRTPINAVLGMDEMILRESTEIPIREYALDIQSAGKSLLSLINDILDISKIDSGKLEIMQVEYDVSSMLHDTMNMIYQKAKSKNLEVDIKVDEELPSRLLGDDIRIRQVLINLLNNAVKYTNTGTVTLAVARRHADSDRIILHFEVKDTGIGIKEEDMPKLFEEFRRIEEGRNRNVEGTGLGMSITLQLLGMMGSHLDVQSVYGEGSCFTFDLEQGIIDDTPIGDLSERIKRQEREYIYMTAFTAPDADILVVDDNAVNRKVLRNLLKDSLMRIDETDSGEGCLKKIINKKYDLIFLDHMMPGMDGLETLHAFPFVKGNLNLKTPVVALTANAVTGAKEMYLSNGFDAFLSKPVVYEKLKDVILKYLPQEKILQQQMPAIVPSEPEQSQEQKEIAELLETLPEINLEYAYLHSASCGDLYDIMVDFARMIDTEADALTRYKAQITEGDNLKQYRVKVHSMKASAAMIGAIHLSGMARMLELAAINERHDVIEAVTDPFVEEWISYKEKLRPVTEHEAAREAETEKKEFDKEVLEEQLMRLQAAMEDMDVDQADGIVQLLKGYVYPEEYRKTMEALYTAVCNLDEENVAELSQRLLEIDE